MVGKASRAVVTKTNDIALQKRLAGGLRTHYFAERERITSAPTVERDLGKRRSAQRFPVVPFVLSPSTGLGVSDGGTSTADRCSAGGLDPRRSAMARARSINRHGGVLAGPPGRHARRHPGPRPLRLVLGLLVVVVTLVFAASVMPAALAYDADDMDDGGVSGAGSSDTSTDDGDSTGPWGPVGYTAPGAVAPTQHEVTPPGPASIPIALPGPPSRATMPGADMMPGIAGWYAGPGGNTGEHGQHESDE
jgi:hypothetical protein